MHVTIPYSSGTVETVIIDKDKGEEIDLPVPVYPSSGEITNPGEMAISTLDGYESICIKSDKNENVMFSNDVANQTKLSTWHNSANGGFALAHNNQNGPVLSLAEGVPLSGQTIINSTSTLTLYVTGHQSEIVGYPYSLTPFKDSESCVVYGFSDNLPGNLNEMKDIKILIGKRGSRIYELNIRNGADIRSAQFSNHSAFTCNSIHGLENVQPEDASSGGHITGETVLAYPLKHKVFGPITASFADPNGTGCRAVASHAEGSNSATFAVGSHAEGYNSSSSGEFSHSEGYESNAPGLCSSAHNGQTSTDTSATASSVYGFQNMVTNLGEFACGIYMEHNVKEERLFSVGDGKYIVKSGDDDEQAFEAPQSTPHSVFKILKGGNRDNTYYYPLFDLSNSKSEYITRDLVIKATITVNNQSTTLTKTIGEWYEFLTSGGN